MMPFLRPAFVSYIRLTTSDYTVQVDVTDSTSQTIAISRGYYLISNRTAASDGQSFLRALQDALLASCVGTAYESTIWTVSLTSARRVQIEHNYTLSALGITLSSNLADLLGFDNTTVSVLTSVGSPVGATADNKPRYWWCPELPPNVVGPEPFDLAVNYGVPSSAGSAFRSSDMTPSYTANGTQYELSLGWRAVQGYHKFRTHPDYVNEDLEGFWAAGPMLGNRMLMFRDAADTATGTAVSGAGSESPYKYIIVAPNAELRGTFPARPVSARNLNYWDADFGLWITEAGESVLST